MRKATDQRDAQTISLLWTTSLLLFRGGDATCFDACHVIWCGGHVIWCDVIACVVSCHVMQCDVMWCALMWFAVRGQSCPKDICSANCGCSSRLWKPVCGLFWHAWQVAGKQSLFAFKIMLMLAYGTACNIANEYHGNAFLSEDSQFVSQKSI